MSRLLPPGATHCVLPLLGTAGLQRGPWLSPRRGVEQSCQSDKHCCLSKVSSHNDSFGERAARAGSSSLTPDRNSISHTNLSLSLSDHSVFSPFPFTLSFSFSHVGPRDRKSILLKISPIQKPVQAGMVSGMSVRQGHSLPSSGGSPKPPLAWRGCWVMELRDSKRPHSPN